MKRTRSTLLFLIRYTSLVFLFGISIRCFSQEKIVKEIQTLVTRQDAQAHLEFLASDEMRGRDTGSPEIAIAANYLAAHFKMWNLKMPPGFQDYFQQVGLQKRLPPNGLELSIGNEVYRLKEDLLLLKGKSFTQESEMVFVGYGSAADFAASDIKGKIVVAFAGTTDSTNFFEAYLKDSPPKYQMTKEKGGVALIEILAQKSVPWQRIAGYFSASRISLTSEGDESGVPHIWMKNSGSPGIAGLIQQKTGRGVLTVDAALPRVVPGKNVVGVIEGTDPRLKEEFVVFSAHYDHIGVKKNESPDSIYNGARDNALGTTAILEVARFLSQHPPKRSAVIVAFTAEEKGLLGSHWYSNHPAVPLKQTVFNLDCDGAGYNDKTIANLIDLNRTTADELLKQGCSEFGLKLTGDPLPDQNLYERSDNYNFAVKGVPAVDFSPGVKSMDAELLKYYHQPPDEVASLDFDYLEKFFRAYVYSAWLIVNAPTRPYWKSGDKFEPAGKTLYGTAK